MNYWEALALPQDTAEEVAEKVTRIIEATDDFYKWDEPNEKNPYVRHLSKMVQTLAFEVAKIKAKEVQLRKEAERKRTT